MVDDNLSVKVYDADKKLVDGRITMSYGLLNVLVREIGDINRVGVIDIDPDLAMTVLSEVLLPRTATGASAAPEGYETPDLPIDQADNIFDWVKEHVMDFFLQRLQHTADLMTSKKDRLAGIGSFLSGSEASVSKSPSSGA